jgi:hypothetical protein
MYECPHCHDEEHIVGIELPWVYDGVLYWHCTACGGNWHRAGTHTGRRWDIADDYVSGRIAFLQEDGTLK